MGDPSVVVDPSVDPSVDPFEENCSPPIDLRSDMTTIYIVKYVA
jgi:hypothetical protein